MEQNTVIEFDYSLALEKLGLPAIMTDSPQKSVFLIDSGSTHNVLSETYYNANKQEIKDSEEKLYMYGVEGNKQIVKRAQMKICICNVEYEPIFNIVDMTASFGKMNAETGIELDGILGMDFLVNNKWALDFGNNVILIPTKGMGLLK